MASKPIGSLFNTQSSNLVSKEHKILDIHLKDKSFTVEEAAVLDQLKPKT